MHHMTVKQGSCLMRAKKEESTCVSGLSGSRVPRWPLQKKEGSIQNLCGMWLSRRSPVLIIIAAVDHRLANCGAIRIRSFWIGLC
jgi:hypothetical protein